MAGLPLILIDVTSSEVYGIPFARLEPPELPSRVNVKETLAPGSIIYRQAEPDTGRVLGNVTWTLSWPALRDAQCSGRNTRSLASLLLYFWDSGREVYLTGAAVLGLSSQPLRRTTTGVYANKRFTSALPWWHSDVAIYQDGVLVSADDYTISADDGYVTFDSAVDAGVVVTATGSRRPRCRVTSVPVTPVNSVYPVQYQLQATLRESTP